MKRSLSILTLFLVASTLAACSVADPKSVAANLPALPTEKVDLALIPMDQMDQPVTVEGEEPEEILRFNEAGDVYLRTYLLDPSEKINNFVDKDEFSRCGSGAYYNLKSKPSDKVPFYMGTVSLNRGCGAGEEFFDFQVSPDGQTLELSDVGKNTYIPYKTWFETAKPLELEFTEGGGA